MHPAGSVTEDTAHDESLKLFRLLAKVTKLRYTSAAILEASEMEQWNGPTIR